MVEGLSRLDTRTGAQMSDESRNTANNPNAGYVYKVQVRTQQSQFMVDGSSRPIREGMTAQADIVTDRRRVIDFL